MNEEQTLQKESDSESEESINTNWDDYPNGRAVSREKAISAVRELGERLGHPPSSSEMDKYGPYSAAYYFNNFDGGWPQVLELAGFDSKFGGPNAVGNTTLADELRAVVEKLGRIPTADELQEHTSRSETTFERRFGSMENAYEEAGIDRKEIIGRRIRDLAIRLGHKPNPQEITNKTEYHHSQVRSVFGDMESAYEYADVEEATTKEAGAWEKIIAGIREVVPENNEAEMSEQIEMVLNDTPFDRDYISKHFGSVENAIIAAGRGGERAGELRKRQFEDLIDDMHAVEEKLGREPTVEEIINHGSYSIAAYTRRFETMANAAAAAGYGPLAPVEASPKQELIEAIQDLAEKHDGAPPNIGAVLAETDYSAEEFMEYFDSWEQALEEAGVN